MAVPYGIFIYTGHSTVYRFSTCACLRSKLSWEMYGCCRCIELVIIFCAALLSTQRSGFEEPAIIRPEPDESKPKVIDVNKGETVSKSVPSVTLPRLLRSRAREVLDCSCLYCRNIFSRKTILPSRNQCDPDFSWTGPDRYYSLVSTNEHRPPHGWFPELTLSRSSTWSNFFSPNWGDPVRLGDHFVGPIQGLCAPEHFSVSLPPVHAAEFTGTTDERICALLNMSVIFCFSLFFCVVFS